uniref:MARVEL domain-containing protein n=1 Tax=Angiostrongylus cantonensis TaxID=6313 RepID=A0A0K0DQR3_ANGCA
MTLAARSRFIFLIISSLLALISTAIITSCLFSVSFRYITDHENLKGTRYYGLIRYCFESEYQTFGTEFELATMILLSSAIASSLLSICFAIFTIFTVFGALAHCVMLLTATICSISAFVVYTYFNELKDNQNETLNGNIIRYHFGWAYYWSGGASAGLFAAFICSLFASACVLLHKQQKNRIDSVVL